MDCSDILKWGIFDIQSTTTQQEFASQLVRWLDFNQITSKEETQSAAAAAGITIPADIPIPLNANMTWGTSNHSFYTSALSEFLRSNVEWKTRFEQLNVQANNSIVSAWQQCMAQHANQSGLSLQAIFHPDDHRQFVLSISARPHGFGEKKIVIKNVDLPTNIKPRLSVEGQTIKSANLPVVGLYVREDNSPATIVVRTSDPNYQSFLTLRAFLKNDPIVFAEPGDNMIQSPESQNATSVAVGPLAQSQWIEVSFEARAQSEAPATLAMYPHRRNRDGGLEKVGEPVTQGVRQGDFLVTRATHRFCVVKGRTAEFYLSAQGWVTLQPPTVKIAVRY